MVQNGKKRGAMAMGECEIIKVVPTVERKTVSVKSYSEEGDFWLHPEMAEEEEFDLKVHELVDWLARQELPNVGNFYADSKMRQLNLIKYFKALFWIKPDLMFIGEAPGIHGCVKTGIPFTSERLIQDGQLDRYFLGTRFDAEGNKAEGSATVIWQAIGRLSKPPVMWNAFPLHLRKKDGKNRTPTTSELKWGAFALGRVLELFPGVEIISIGKKAESACEKVGAITSGHLIHPAYHTNEFREQFDSHFFKRA
ncbi:uracil-DNA glycosylase [Paenibacillus lemnae]|uniref:Uracil-DNA glycosylase-like domain-containing protein n=1 Tax=Paenibacillus lemnae TaxID=1330551 RepID=A0A848M8A1_PAELE|nr:uracil-DNA glycosylase [Paenibacillus lemnae]NMO96312.1 hypothetical protein [Paenibacillus lemnae]